MGLPDRIRNLNKPSSMLVHLEQTIQRAELDVADHQAKTWAAAEKRRTDIAARGELTRHALQEDVRTYQEGMATAHGHAVIEELTLRYLEDQNGSNRSDVRRF